jgi:integrase
VSTPLDIERQVDQALNAFLDEADAALAPWNTAEPAASPGADPNPVTTDEPEAASGGAEDAVVAALAAAIGIEPAAPEPITGAASVLSLAFSEGKRLRLVEENVVTGVRLPTVPRIRPVIWNDEQAARFLDVVYDDEIFGALYVVALITGMRPGELRALQWENVHLDDGYLIVCATITRDIDGKQIISPQTKGKEPRGVALSSQVIERLHCHRERQQERRSAAKDWHDLDIVFDRGNGMWIAQQSWARAHHSFCQKAGVPKTKLHGLRHTSATLELRAKTPDKIVSERLGHKDPGFTKRFYQHVDHELQIGAVTALSERLLRTNLRNHGENGENLA